MAIQQELLIRQSPHKLPQSAFLRYRSDCPAAKLMATWKLSAQVIQENVQLPSVNIQQELDEKFLVPIDISKTGQTRCNYFLDEWNFSSLVESMLCNLDECAYYLKLFYHCFGKWQGRDCQETNTCGYLICMFSHKKYTIFCFWIKICTSPAIFAKCSLLKQRAANKHKEVKVTSRTRVSQSDYGILLFLFS